MRLAQCCSRSTASSASEDAEPPEKIVVSASRIANLGDGFARTWRRPPSEQELQGLIEDYVRDEVFYREGRAAGLDRDDVIIRRRVRQKMEFLAEEMSAPEPSDEQLDSLPGVQSGALPSRRSDYIPAGLPECDAAREYHRERQQTDCDRPGSRDAAVDTTSTRRSLPAWRGISRRLGNKVANQFGESFAKRIFAMEKGRWQGPVSSGFGQHFVFISERVSGGLPPLDAVRPAVRREWANARRLEAEQKLYASLRERYEIVVEAPPAKAASAEAGR